MLTGFIWQRIREPFVYPVPPAPRTAVLVPWFRPTLFRLELFSPATFRPAMFPATMFPSQPVRIFPQGWGDDAARFEPSAVAATIEQIRLLCGILIPSLTHALVVLERPGWPRLTEEDRNAFWRAFRVPVFEQIIGPSGQLLAGECEAHGGLHIEGPGLHLTHDMVDITPCPCGRKTVRFGVPRQALAERRAAAYAR